MIRTINLMKGIFLFRKDVIKSMALGICKQTVGELYRMIKQADCVVHEKLIND